MNSNVTPLHGVSGVERTAPAGDAASRPKPESSELPVTVNNLSDLKKAELRGEYYTISDEQLIKSIERAIKAMQGRTTSLEFSIHKETKSICVKVLDKESGELIREIPPEKNLDFVAKLWQMAGILVDEKL